jgi:hypothetical protein
MATIEITAATRHEVFGPAAHFKQGRQLALQPGCLPRMWGYGKMHNVQAAEEIIEPIPRSKWKQLILEGQGTFIHDRCKPVLPPSDQNGTNYCWAHAAVRAFTTFRVIRGHDPRRLSAASVAVPITGGRNIGGYPEKAIMQLRASGACELDLWPDDQRRAPKDVLAMNASAMRNRIIRWIDVRTWEMQVTCAFLRIPLAIGLNWWGHAVCQLDPVILSNGDVGIGIDNSWGADWSEYGYGTLDEEHGTSDMGAFGPTAEGWSP